MLQQKKANRGPQGIDRDGHAPRGNFEKICGTMPLTTTVPRGFGVRVRTPLGVGNGVRLGVVVVRWVVPAALHCWLIVQGLISVRYLPCCGVLVKILYGSGHRRRWRCWSCCFLKTMLVVNCYGSIADNWHQSCFAINTWVNSPLEFGASSTNF